jgi:dCMP deaminase
MIPKTKPPKRGPDAIRDPEARPLGVRLTREFLSRRWLLRCSELSINSDDPHTRVGCVIVGPNGEPRSEGWNSLPRNVQSQSGRLERPEKYLWIEHAERNAIFLAARSGTPLDGCTLYVPLLPCAECARGIIQAGIKEVVISAQAMELYEGERYREDHLVAAKMLSEAGVTVYRF